MNAFLHGSLGESMFIEQPQAVINQQFPHTFMPYESHWVSSYKKQTPLSLFYNLAPRAFIVLFMWMILSSLPLPLSSLLISSQSYRNHFQLRLRETEPIFWGLKSSRLREDCASPKRSTLPTC